MSVKQDGLSLMKEIQFLMSSEREALLRADRDALQLNLNQRARMIRRIEQEKVNLDEENLRKIKEILNESSELLIAAESGFQSALEKVKSIRQASQTLRVYSQDGHIYSTSKEKNCSKF